VKWTFLGLFQFEPVFFWCLVLFGSVCFTLILFFAFVLSNACECWTALSRKIENCSICLSPLTSLQISNHTCILSLFHEILSIIFNFPSFWRNFRSKFVRFCWLFSQNFQFPLILEGVLGKCLRYPMCPPNTLHPQRKNYIIQSATGTPSNICNYGVVHKPGKINLVSSSSKHRLNLSWTRVWRDFEIESLTRILARGLVVWTTW
jgi:hypothetical protein